MKFIKTYEGSWGRDVEKSYYVQNGEGYDKLRKIKQGILDSMNPPMQDVWLDLDDYLLPLVEKYGKFTTKYDTDRKVIDADSLDLVVDIGNNNYHIAHENNTEYIRGNSFPVKRNSENKRIISIDQSFGGKKAGDLDDNLSHYGSDFDQEFYDFYIMKNRNIDPFYEILIGVESEYLETNIDRLDEINRDVISYVSKALKRLNVKIIVVNEYNDSKGGSSNWKKVKTNNLSNIKYPRFVVGFKI